ncbi:MAG: methyltransferase domain-containing protein [Candidatus Dadabacteria bacterium]|nr:methyltransferase domain-containing protein [Candidatus Dadabacteria bacterium]NIQ15276.1 methyltransferase domain-containing protein [Candidatus Dadabacteria bacterium]
MINNKHLKAAQNHYSNIAHIYRELRITDSEPVLLINDYLKDIERIVAADVGSGAGRYAKLFFDHFGKDRLFLKCYDTNEFMLESLEEYLKQHNISNYLTKIAMAQELPIKDNSLNSIFCFNAIHYFNINKFLKECVRVLKDESLLFIYTRTRTQSEESVWGKYFPLYNAKESRLYEPEEFEFILERRPRLEIVERKVFSFNRNNSVEDLVRRASSKHYSTFELYEDEEFKRSLERFEDNLNQSYSDASNIDWLDEKTMYVIKKTD